MDFAFLLLAIVGIAIYWAWNSLRGDTVGAAKGVVQGEYAVPGAPVRAVVKRHMSGGRPEVVELQLWTWGVTKRFRLDPRDALAIAQLVEQAAAEARGEP